MHETKTHKRKTHKPQAIALTRGGLLLPAASRMPGLTAFAFQGRLDLLQGARASTAELIAADACAAAAAGGHLHVLQWLVQAQLPPCLINEKTTRAAASSGSLEVLQWLVARGCPVTVDCARVAAGGGHLDILMFLRMRGMLFPIDVCKAAAAGGHLGVLSYLRSLAPQTPWDKSVCCDAVESGSLPVLQWLRAQDPPCPWDSDCCYTAAVNNNLPMLQWLREQEPPCPWTWETVDIAARLGHADLAAWAAENGCPQGPEEEGEEAALLVMQQARAPSQTHAQTHTQALILEAHASPSSYYEEVEVGDAIDCVTGEPFVDGSEAYVLDSCRSSFFSQSTLNEWFFVRGKVTNPLTNLPVAQVTKITILL